MSLVKRNSLLAPFAWESELDKLFNSFVEPVMTSKSWMPSMDVLDEDSTLKIVADLPGMTKENIDITLEGNRLVVSGERTEENGNYSRMERTYGKFSRSVGLPNGVNLDDIEARFTDGVLQVTIPKPEDTKPKQIEIT